MNLRTLILPVSIFLIYNLALLWVLFHDPVPENLVTGMDNSGYSASIVSSENQGINLSVESVNHINIGQLFTYTIHVDYDPELVSPDFRKFIRNVRFVPFEQMYLSRPTISEGSLHDGRQRYLLSYPILGINVIPHTSYILDTVEISYLDLTTNKSRTIGVQPNSIQITGYHPKNYFGIPFQPVKKSIETYLEAKKLAIWINATVFLILGFLLIYNSVRRHNIQVSSMADKIREKLNSVETGQVNNRKGIFAYEKLYLALISQYREHSAQEFWQGRLQDRDSRWNDNLANMKQELQSAYAYKEPENKVIVSIKQGFEKIFKFIEKDNIREKIDEIERIQGTFKQRIKNYKYSFLAGLISIITGFIFIFLLAKPSVWMDTDVIYFNEWISNLPEKLFDEERTSELESIDVELMGHVTEQQNTLDNLKGEYFKSAFLYNYGTIMSNAIVAIMTSSNEIESEEIEEDEIVEPPSFEFPVQLLANAVRFYPSDLDARKNLELAIMYWINEKKDESGEVQGEVGPPLPGFSRDMNEIQY